MNDAVSQAITRRSASNLALAFVLLPRDKREAMAVLYAWCREVDDVADNAERPVADREVELAAWREDVRAACQGGPVAFAVNRELIPVVTRHRLPFALFDELIRGVEMDLHRSRYPTYAELETYCYRVASVVGLLSIEIFGYRNPACREYAVALGKALQFTNILRDVRNDAERGRIYLPTEELERAGVCPDEILHGQYSERFERAAASFAARARAFYRQARQTLPPEDRRSMVAAELMGSVYWRLLQLLDRRGYNVFGSDLVRVNRPEKCRLILRTWWRWASGSTLPNYGTP